MDPFCVNLDRLRIAHPRLNGVLPDDRLQDEIRRAPELARVALTGDDTVEEAMLLALIRELATRTLKLNPYHVQLVGTRARRSSSAL